jgi:hypothetical protein
VVLIAEDIGRRILAALAVRMLVQGRSSAADPAAGACLVRCTADNPKVGLEGDLEGDPGVGSQRAAFDHRKAVADDDAGVVDMMIVGDAWDIAAGDSAVAETLKIQAKPRSRVSL